MTASNQFYGWFEDPTGSPAYDPPHDAPCPLCGRKIKPDDVRTHSLMYTDVYAARSYFYRTHRTCSEDAGPVAADAFILDMIARNGD